MAGAAAPAAAASAAGEATGRRRGCTRAGRGKDGKLDRGFLAGTFGAGDLLLLVDDDLLETLVAGIADVFVDGHG